MKEFKEKVLIYHWILLIAGTIFPLFSYAQIGKHYTLNE